MISPINNSQHTTPASEAKKQPRKLKAQTQAPKNGALSHDQVTLKNSGQVNREEQSE
jgi:hypothetical protein